MHPFRILILGILVYILFRLFLGKKKLFKQGNKNSGSELAVHDVLVEDPVCHTYIPKGQAVVCNYRHNAFYFCSEKCRRTFLADKGDTE